MVLACEYCCKFYTVKSVLKTKGSKTTWLGTLLLIFDLCIETASLFYGPEVVAVHIAFTVHSFYN